MITLYIHVYLHCTCTVSVRREGERKERRENYFLVSWQPRIDRCDLLNRNDYSTTWLITTSYAHPRTHQVDRVKVSMPWQLHVHVQCTCICTWTLSCILYMYTYFNIHCTCMHTIQLHNNYYSNVLIGIKLIQYTCTPVKTEELYVQLRRSEITLMITKRRHSGKPANCILHS